MGKPCLNTELRANQMASQSNNKVILLNDVGGRIVYR